MLANYHTHTTYCDGKYSIEQNIMSAIEQGLSAIGFSGHGYGDHCPYGMKKTPEYIAEIKQLRNKYKDKIQVYVGVEEDSDHLLNRSDYEYIIGSCHFIKPNQNYYPIDSSIDTFNKCVDVFNGDVLALAEHYYQRFVSYIIKRKPDLIGHFDLITKFEEKHTDYYLTNEKYWKIAEKYTLEALKSQCVFEVNTGMISRGYRTSPCPHDRLLHLIKKNGGNVCFSADAHDVKNLVANFNETKILLKDIGFTHTIVLYNNEWKKHYL